VNKTIPLGLTNAILGLFRPPANKNALTQYGIANNRRIYFNWFPGYFTDPADSNTGFPSARRWTPNNGIAVVNDQPGTLIDTATVANNSMFIYNINSGSATYGVELAAFLKFGLVDDSDTTFFYYDTGEPAMTYKDAVAGVRSLNGNPLPVLAGKRLILVLTETFSQSGTSFENLYDPNDVTTPKTLNFNPAAGITVTKGNEFVIYGVTKPIASTVTATTTPYKFAIDNRIARINCTITDSTGALVSTGMHDVNLSRFYDVGGQTRYNSLWEFDIEVTGLPAPGTYNVTLAGLDVSGTTVAQTSAMVPVTVLPVVSPVNGESDGSSSLLTPQSAISPGTHAGLATVFTFSPGPSANAGSVFSIALTPIRDIGQVQCLVQLVTPGAALQLRDRDVAYELITVNWINADAIGHADITFTIRKSWLTKHNLKPGQIVMMRYTNNLEVDPAFEKIFGIRCENAVGRLSRDAFGRDEPAALALYARVVGSGIPENFEIWYPPMQKHFAISVYSPTKGTFAMVFEDITDRKRKTEELMVAYERIAAVEEELWNNFEELATRELALRSSDERYRRIVETANAGSWEMDADLKTTYVNRQLAGMLGYSGDEMIGHGITEFTAVDEHLENNKQIQH